MELTKGMLKGLTRILRNVYPFITDIIDYKFDHSDETPYNFHNHTFYIDVDVEMLSKMTGYKIDYDYIDDHKNWSSPFWGLIAPIHEDYDLSLISDINMPPQDYISSMIRPIFVGVYDNDNIDVYFNSGK
jgi:hypothetical protein